MRLRPHSMRSEAVRAKDYNRDWSLYFTLSEESESGLVWATPRYFKGTPNFDRLGKNVGSVTKGRNKYWTVGLGGDGSYLIHRIIWVMLNGKIDVNEDVDHIDGNGLNNKHTNLRAVEKKINSRNKRLRKDSTTGVNGVHYSAEPVPNPKNISDGYRAQFTCLDGELKRKHFSIRLYGKEKAFELACAWYASMLALTGSGYTNRHGRKE